VAAILKDTLLEIRTSSDKYSSIVGMVSRKIALMIHMCLYILTPWSRALLEKLTSKLSR